MFIVWCPQVIAGLWVCMTWLVLRDVCNLADLDGNSECTHYELDLYCRYYYLWHNCCIYDTIVLVAATWLHYSEASVQCTPLCSTTLPTPVHPTVVSEQGLCSVLPLFCLFTNFTKIQPNSNGLEGSSQHWLTNCLQQHDPSSCGPSGYSGHMRAESPPIQQTNCWIGGDSKTVCRAPAAATKAWNQARALYQHTAAWKKAARANKNSSKSTNRT